MTDGTIGAGASGPRTRMDAREPGQTAAGVGFEPTKRLSTV
jgi:hypothetical protein